MLVWPVTLDTPTVCPQPRMLDPERLRAIREARGVSRERLAVAAGISSRTILRAELAQARPQPVVVAALAMALGVTVEALTKCDDPALTGEVVKDRGDRPDGAQV
jgi:transcriptional regulator with XRE-family HTH domain